MRDFTKDDLAGAGHYLVLYRANPNEFTDPGYLSTMMVKVGWRGSCYSLIDMSDGFIHTMFNTQQGLIDFLNDTSNEEYRFATKQEVVAVISQQHGRWRNI